MASKPEKIYVAGHRGMVGSAIARRLRKRSDAVLVTRTRAELELTSQEAVRAFFEAERPERVIFAAGRAGGIQANNAYPAEFIYQNLLVEFNVVHEAWRVGVEKLLFLGSSCIYPRFAPRPFREEALLTGALEPLDEPEAIAKIAGIKLCESYNRQYGTDYRSVMSTNLYGPGDDYHPDNAHVIPSLIRRFHEAKAADARSVVIWGSGNARREFLYVEDLAEAALHIMDLDQALYRAKTRPMLSQINVGSGRDIAIRELAGKIAQVVGYRGAIEHDPAMPDGSPQKLMDVSLAGSLGWKPRVGLDEGLAMAYRDFLSQQAA